MYYLGIDIGYSSVKLMLIDKNHQLVFERYQRHQGKIKNTLLSIITEMTAAFPEEKIQFGYAIGSGNRLLLQTENIRGINEAAALVEGCQTVYKSPGSIIEIGSESAKFITRLDDPAHIEISMNSNCSAGTGSFLEEQMSRLNLDISDYSALCQKSRTIPRIAGRCSVFAKTDITHHQQEGVAVEDILMGLAYAVVRNYKSAVIKKLPLQKPVLFVGNVAGNDGIVTALKDVLELSDSNLIIPDHYNTIGAYGAALLAIKDQAPLDLTALKTALNSLNDVITDNDSIPLMPLDRYSLADPAVLHQCRSLDKDDVCPCYLGVDVGSTSTNLVLMDPTGAIIAWKYLRTCGNPIQAIAQGLKAFKDEYASQVQIVGAGVTGSGRYMIGKLIGADVVRDEITAQARAAIAIDPEVDTIFEIGGQDSKYIGLQNGVVTHFQMNKICAAGTGSFIEEQSKKFNIPVDDFGPLALTGKRPINLGERCSVFIESSIAGHLARGADLSDIAAGLCYAIVKNYLGRVVGNQKIGNKIFLQGGVAFNPGIVSAFKAQTGKDIVVPPFFSVTGAYGAALLAQEGMNTSTTAFVGFDLGDPTDFLKIYQLESDHRKPSGAFSKKMNDFIFSDASEQPDPTKKTVGIPRALFTYGMFPMFYTIFKELGFNVKLSDPTTEETISMGQQYSLDETCYPIKLINGHVAQLVAEKVDYLFFPDLFSVNHPGSPARKDYGCAYMQLAFKVINQAMALDEKGITLLSPTIGFTLGKLFMMESFAKMGQQLGKTRKEAIAALQKGIQAFEAFEDKIEENGRKTLAALKAEQKAFVLVSKVYGVADPVLNLGIPDKLIEMGYPVIPFCDMPEDDISSSHPNMFWPFGQHILEPAHLIKAHPNLYGVLLTHHGCGPDSVLSHYFREIMGDKPYLHIEVDEHSSEVGIITRVEAFVNSLEKIKPTNATRPESYLSQAPKEPLTIKESHQDLPDQATLYLPNLFPYSDIFAEILQHSGVNTRVLSKTSRQSVDRGRGFSLTEEYFSMTALLGDIFQSLESEKPDHEHPIAFYLPQNEGTETDGQYSRILRTKLNEAGFEKIAVVSPFLEDALYRNVHDVKTLFLGLLAGDLIRISVFQLRYYYLSEILNLIRTDTLNLTALRQIAEQIGRDLQATDFKKRVFAGGETMVLYNDYLNNFTFSRLEKKGHRIIYSPLSEALWLMWYDYENQKHQNQSPETFAKLLDFSQMIQNISTALGAESPFEENLEALAKRADETVGYYAGSFGRYRSAKQNSQQLNAHGIINVSSMYENTGIVLGILQKSFNPEAAKPTLNLTYDGNQNEHDEKKLDSFLYYL